MIPQISVFTDCNSKSLVMRLPYKFAVEIISTAKDCEEKQEVIKWLNRQSSPELKKYIKEMM